MVQKALAVQNFLPAVAFVTTIVLLALLQRIKVLESVRDIPNHRSLHSSPIPRIGGVGLWGGAAAGLLVLDRADFGHLIVPGFLLATLSFVDDVRGLPTWSRFIAHFSAAAWFVLLALGSVESVIFQIVLLLAIVWMTNLYNFMDGSDGLAGGMAAVGFSAYGVGALMSGSPDLSVFSFCIATAALGFLMYNFHPARIFLGDAGSIPLGFAAGSVGLLGWNRGSWPLWFPLLVFSPFIVDATLTLVMRFSRREKIWEGHREHYYQRMVRMGWGHRRTALLEYVLMMCVGSSALAALRWTQSTQVILLVAWALVYFGLAFLLDRAWRLYQTVQPASS